MRTSADSITPKITSMESKRGSFRDSGKWRAGWYSASSLGEPTLLPKKIVLFLPISENAASSTLQRVLADESSHAWIVPALVFIVQTCRLAYRFARKPVTRPVRAKYKIERRGDIKNRFCRKILLDERSGPVGYKM